MQLVVDASAYFPICVTGSVPRHLAQYDLVGPSILWPETLSALREAAWRGAMPEALARTAAGRLMALGVTAVVDQRLPIDAYDIAAALGWAKTYDAEYVALAKMLDAPLLTRDARLRRGAQRLISFLDLDLV